MSHTLSPRLLRSSICTQCPRTLKRKLAYLSPTTTRPKPTSLSPSKPPQRHLSNTTVRSVSPLWPPDSATSRVPYYTHLLNRTLIRLAGSDVPSFLHNLLPASIAPLSDTQRWLYSAFLNAKGRILYDVYIYAPSSSSPETWYLDVDTNSADDVIRHIKKHKLRAKFQIQRLDPQEMQVTYVWPRDSSVQGRAEDGSDRNTQDKLNAIHQQDPRPGMGKRILMSEPSMSGLQGDSMALPWEDYMVHRIINGFAEGPVEISSGSALPQESNFDMMHGGIDFGKGCYLGQELTIRTRHTGVVRKRILPVRITEVEDAPGSVSSDSGMGRSMEKELEYDPTIKVAQPPVDANIKKIGGRGRSGKSVGKWLGGYGNVGLALCRLEAMTDIDLTAEGSTFDKERDMFQVEWADGLDGTEKKVNVRAFVPMWLRRGLDEEVKARREKRGQRMTKEENEIEEEVEEEGHDLLPHEEEAGSEATKLS